MKNKISIFIVEDNEIYTMMLNEQLKNVLVDYYLTTFTSGKECIKLLYLNPDIIILDYCLEEENGLDVLKAIKKENPKIPIIILSHQKDVHTVIKLLNEGAMDYIVKERDAYLEVKNAIFNILEKKQLEEENFTLKIKFNKARTMMALLAIVILALGVVTASLFIENGFGR